MLLDKISTEVLDGFAESLTVERNLSANTISAYLTDLGNLAKFMQEKPLAECDLNDLHIYLISRIDESKNVDCERAFSELTQARTISAFRTFFKYLQTEELRKDNPADLLDLPKYSRDLPTVLSVEEIDKLCAECDLESEHGLRNRAIIETLYSTGLRVTELVNLSFDKIIRDETNGYAYLRVIGKGDKERIAPLGKIALDYIERYRREKRDAATVAKNSEGVIFLNNRGAKLTRVMIFYIVKELAMKAGIAKTVTPHTFRHSFATHLIENGADIVAVRDLLGHTSILTTQVYLNVQTKMLHDTIRDYHPRGK